MIIDWQGAFRWAKFSVLLRGIDARRSEGLIFHLLQ
jgi:hypothetical protein